MNHQKMNLSQAYQYLRNVREEIRPNSGFFAQVNSSASSMKVQLMELDQELYCTRSLTWDEIETGYDSIEDWLKANDNPQVF